MDVRLYVAIEDAIQVYKRTLLGCDKDDDFSKDLKEEIEYLEKYLKEHPAKEV